jgi:hypothetical protein
VGIDLVEQVVQALWGMTQMVWGKNYLVEVENSNSLDPLHNSDLEYLAWWVGFAEQAASYQ